MQKLFILLTAALFTHALAAQNSTPAAAELPYKTLNAEAYANAGDFSEGLAAVKINNLWGFIDTTGKVVIAPQFNPYQAQFNATFSDGLVAINFTSAQKSGALGNDPVGLRWGFADKTGKVVIKPKFEGNYYDPPHFANGLAVIGGSFIGTTIATFGMNTKYGYINKTGALVIAQKFDEAFDFSEELASVKVGGKYGFIDKTGRLVIPAIYDAPGFFREGIAIVEQDKLSYVIDKNNHKVFDKGYTGLSSYSEGLARIEVDGKVGFIDKSGNIKIKPKFTYSSTQKERQMFFSEDLCQYEQGGNDSTGRMYRRFGYVNKAGKTVIEPQFDYAGPFKNGYAVVSVNGYYGFINKTGKFVIQPIFANVGYFVDGIARVSGGAGFGDYKFRFIKMH